MELNGALSNPQAGVELRKLGNLSEELLALAATDPRRPRSVQPRALPISDTITAVLQRVEGPMTIPDIRVAVEALLGETISPKRNKAALSAGTLGRSPRFKRVRRGVYE
jgi:hypothetical protein